MLIKSIVVTCVLIITVTFIARWAVGRYTPDAEGLYQGGDTLNACPESPNCISSTYTDDSHHAPTIEGDKQLFDTLKSIVTSTEGATVISNSEDYLHAEFRSKLLGYVDDLELLYRDGSNLIQVRSASRLGKSDFGVNNKRVQTLLKKLQNGT